MIEKVTYIEVPFLKNGVLPVLPCYHIAVDSGFWVTHQTTTVLPMLPLGASNDN